MTIRVAPLTGAAMQDALPALARLRVEVFRAWPYLYEGTAAYEEEYLERFAIAENAIIVAAYDGPHIVGVSTGTPILHHAKEFAAPFLDAGINLSEFFYFGESVLKSTYRGHGVGHKFFDERESHAKRLGYKHATFCSVVREMSHPLRRPDYVPLDGFWTKRGYRKMEGIITWFKWTDVGECTSSEKPMQFWSREL